MKVRQNEIVLFTIIKDGEYGLLNPLTKKLHRINETGRIIWEQCKEPKSTEELASMVANHFDIPIEDACIDIESFVGRLLHFNLFEKV